MFQEIGECMTQATDGVGSIHDVLSRASRSSVFFFRSFGAAVFFLVTAGLRYFAHTAPCSKVSCPKKNLREAYTKSLMRWKN